MQMRPYFYVRIRLQVPAPYRESSYLTAPTPPRNNQQQQHQEEQQQQHHHQEGQQQQEQEEGHPDFHQQKQDIGSCTVKMCPMINMLISPDHGLGHNCGSATQDNINFDTTHEVITYILNSIYQIYHAGQVLYDDYRPCKNMDSHYSF